jgi:hypothetical protein
LAWTVLYPSGIVKRGLTLLELTGPLTVDSFNGCLGRRVGECLYRKEP